MTYAIIQVAGKQYRVREGDRLLVDRLAHEDRATFSPTVLLLGGDGAPVFDAPEGTVTARVVGAVQGPKIRIGKYKKRTGYRRHTGFRAALTQIEIESIAHKTARGAAKPKAEKPVEAAKAELKPEKPKPAVAPTALPAGYADLTVAEIKAGSADWSSDELSAALAFEQEHGQRKGAIAALESALTRQGGES